jgi:hypothetical protein
MPAHFLSTRRCWPFGQVSGEFRTNRSKASGATANIHNSRRFKTLLIHFIDAASYSAAIPELDIEVLS